MNRNPSALYILLLHVIKMTQMSEYIELAYKEGWKWFTKLPIIHVAQQQRILTKYVYKDTSYLRVSAATYIDESSGRWGASMYLKQLYSKRNLDNLLPGKNKWRYIVPLLQILKMSYLHTWIWLGCTYLRLPSPRNESGCRILSSALSAGYCARSCEVLNTFCKDNGNTQLRWKLHSA